MSVDVLVSRMRIATLVIVHQSPVARLTVVGQRPTDVAKVVRVAPFSDIQIVSRRHFQEPIVRQMLVDVLRVADQFPTYSDYSR